MNRKVMLTSAAADDVHWQNLTRDEYKAVLVNLKKLADLSQREILNIVQDCDNDWLCMVASTDNEWMRMIAKPENIRVFVTYDDTSVTVECILHRSQNTYTMARLIYQRGKTMTASSGR